MIGHKLGEFVLTKKMGSSFTIVSEIGRRRKRCVERYSEEGA